MSIASRLLAGLVVIGLALPTSTLAHAGGEPFLHVPVDRVIQGDAFTVIAADLGPNALVALEISSSGEVFPLGEVVAQPDGHFTATFVMPPGIADGYAELWARSDDGVQAMLWVLVGDGADTGAPGSPSLPILALAAAWAVGLAAIGFVFLRSRTPVQRRRRRRS
jgi:hypothetical protein